MAVWGGQLPRSGHRHLAPVFPQIFEGRVVESEGRSGSSSHVITAVGGSGSSQQTFNYATERVVGNGSFGVVFQATCLETAETVSRAARGV